MIRLNALLLFYRLFMIPSGVISLCCCYILLEQESLMMLPACCWLKVLSDGILVYLWTVWQPNGFQLYRNLGWQKRTLLLCAFLIDITLFSVLLALTWLFV